MSQRFTSRSRTHIAYLAILAIVWHALLPLAHAASLGNNSLSSICSPGSSIGQGLLQVPFGRDDAPTIDLQKRCPLCIAGAQLSLPAAPGLAFIADAALSHVQVCLSAPTATHVAPWLLFSPRAPPRA